MHLLENTSKHLRVKNNTNSVQILWENWKGGNTSQLFCKAGVSVIPKQDKDIKKNPIDSSSSWS